MSDEKHVFAGVDCTKIISDFKKRMEEDEKYRKRIAEEINGIMLEFELMHQNAKLPSYAHDGDAGMDVFAVEDVTLPKGIPTLVKTGLRCKIPDGYELQVRPRSGLAVKGVTVWNSPGTIDSKYRGEIGVILMYHNNECVTLTEKRRDPRTGEWINVGVGTGPKGFHEIKAGDKIAQLVLAPVYKARPVKVDKVDTDTDRGEGGFGSTGV